MTNIAKEIIQNVYDFFKANPDKWAQGAFAYDEERYRVSPKSPYAICWCAEGYIFKEYGPKYGNNNLSTFQYVDSACRKVTDMNIVQLNDGSKNLDEFLGKIEEVLASGFQETT